MDSKFDLKYTEKSLEDLDGIFNYISNVLKNLNAALNLSNKMQSSINNLCIFPRIGSSIENNFILDNNIKKIVVDNYSIIYYADFIGKRIIIIRVINNKMDINEILKSLDF